MKFMLVVLFCAVGLCAALPTKPAHSSVLDLLNKLEDLVEEDGKSLFTKLVNVIHHVEDSLLKVKEMVPKAYEKIHKEADEVLAGLKKVTDEVRGLIGKNSALYSFDLLDTLTELSGGTKLKTALELLSLADKAHKVIQDAKGFVPHLEKTLQKMQTTVENHVTDFAAKVLKELGLQDVSSSVMEEIEDLITRVEKEGHTLVLDLLHKMQQTIEILKEKMPEEYHKVETAVQEISNKIHEMAVEIEKSLVLRSFSLFDLAGDVSSGTSLSTAFKVMSLIDKFNTVMQDVKNFGPRAEAFLEHSVKKVADSAQTFFSHAADKLLEF